MNDVQNPVEQRQEFCYAATMNIVHIRRRGMCKIFSNRPNLLGGRDDARTKPRYPVARIAAPAGRRPHRHP
jgi:hypothetical protein